MSATTTSPAWKRPGATAWPTLGAWKVTVSGASTAAPATLPVDASTPDGRSTATTGTLAGVQLDDRRAPRRGAARRRSPCRRARRRRGRRPQAPRRTARRPRFARARMTAASPATFSSAPSSRTTQLPAARGPARARRRARRRRSRPCRTRPRRVARRGSGASDLVGDAPARALHQLERPARDTPPRRRASPPPCRAARSVIRTASTTPTAAASPCEWVIERSISPAPTRPDHASTRPESRTDGLGRPAISTSFQANARATPKPSALPDRLLAREAGGVVLGRIRRASRSTRARPR